MRLGCFPVPVGPLLALALLRPWGTISLVVPPAEDDAAAGSSSAEELPTAVEVLSPTSLDSLTTRRCAGPAAVVFHGGRVAAPGGGLDDYDRTALDEFQAAAVEVDQMACFGTISCDVYPNFCDESNVASTPSMLLFVRTPSLQVKDYAGDWSKTAILSAIVKHIKLRARDIRAVASDGANAFLADELRPLKALLFTSRKATPVVIEALSADEKLWPHIRFGVAKHTDKELTARFQITEVPKLVLVWDFHRKPNGTLAFSRLTYLGQEMNFLGLRSWLRERVDAHLADPGAWVLNSSSSMEDDAMEHLASLVEAGTVLVARFPATIFTEPGSWDTLRLINGGQRIVASGPVQHVGGFELVPVEPSGVVELSSFALLQDLPPYQQLPYGTDGCPEGLHIESAEECEAAIVALGMAPRPAWISNFPGLPSYCSVREQAQSGSAERMHFNSAKGGVARADLAPVCLLPQEAAQAAAQTFAHSTSGAEAAEKGAKTPNARPVRPAMGAKAAKPAPVKPAPAGAGAASTAAGSATARKEKGKSEISTEIQNALNKMKQTNTPDVKERTQARQAKKAELARKSDFQQLEFGALGCPPGLEIPSVDECERAILSLGIITRPAWISAFPGLPSKCSVRESPTKGSPERMHFNSAQEGTPRSDLAPVCKKARGDRSPDAGGDTAAASAAAAAAVAAEEEEDGESPLLPELSGATQEELLSGSGALVYLREGPLTAPEAVMLMSLKERFRPRWQERGMEVRWMWLDLRAERKLKGVFDAPALPSAILLDPRGEAGNQPAYAVAVHREEDGEAQPVQAEEIELLLNTFLGGDATFVVVPPKRLHAWAPRRGGV
mmetsp:Transcript_123868/g.396577  ORF Transcript_123868/g.396577 Transcript_123868/m.396577 type:complete len:842 (-) Transcript_123868:30-2555(-)